MFCYNVEDKVKINYSDGSIKEDNRGILTTKFIEKFKKLYSDKRQKKIPNINLIVNVQTKKYHYEDCSILKNIEPKYIKEITTKENGYSICKICEERR